MPAKKVVWLTFDDGNEDFYTIAYPILKKYKAKATNNVITGFVKKGNAGNLTVKQMKEMMAHGMSFQSHTVNHPDLSATDKATQKVELTDSIDFLENKLNTKVNTIAYPSGRYNQTTLDLAKKTYKLGLTTNEDSLVPRMVSSHLIVSVFCQQQQLKDFSARLLLTMSKRNHLIQESSDFYVLVKYF